MGFDSPALRFDAGTLTNSSRGGTLGLRVSIEAVTLTVQQASGRKARFSVSGGSALAAKISVIQSLIAATRTR
jgi:hypothetical protein